MTKREIHQVIRFEINKMCPNKNDPVSIIIFTYIKYKLSKKGIFVYPINLLYLLDKLGYNIVDLTLELLHVEDEEVLKDE